MKELNPRQVVKLKNKSCPYCRELLDDHPTNEDHMIARKFVPKGKLHGSWNLILRACVKCNNQKSSLEDDISAITLQPDAFGVHVDDDPVILAESIRKSRSVSRLTQKSVSNSSGSTVLSGFLGPDVQFSLTLESPPTFDQKRVLELARQHLAALFYWFTYDSETSRGKFWVDDSVAINIASNTDWGNAYQVSFMKAILAWKPCMLVIAADGYFKATFRKHPDGSCLAWALEWNRRLRLIGLIGDSAAITEFADQLEAPASLTLQQADGGLARIRQDIPLKADEDTLFQM